MGVDVKRVFRYSPEIFLHAWPIDLSVGENKYQDYAGFSPYIVSLYGVSFARYDGLSFSAGADGVADIIKLEDLGAVKGLDWEEECKVHAVRTMSFRVTAPSAVTAYQLRHKVKVDKPNALLKMQLGISLTNREKALAEKYGLAEKLTLQTLAPYDAYAGVETIHPVAKRMTASGTILRLPVPKDMKIILLDVAVYRPVASAQAYITVKRDDVENTLRVDPYCLQGLEQPIGLWPKYPIRIVALDELLVELEWTAGTHRIRLVYGVGKLTIPEKIKWKPELLTDEEIATAEKLGLYEKIEAGLS